MCIPKLSVPQVQTPAAAPPPNQAAATVNQSNAVNNSLNSNSSYNAAAKGTSALTIPLAGKPSMGGTGPTGLGIPTS